MEKSFKKVINGYTIRWCPKLCEYHIRKGKQIIGRTFSKYDAIEVCKTLKAS